MLIHKNIMVNMKHMLFIEKFSCCVVGVCCFCFFDFFVFVIIRKSKIKKGFDPVVKKGYGSYFPKTIPISKEAMDLIAKLLESDPAVKLLLIFLTIILHFASHKHVYTKHNNWFVFVKNGDWSCCLLASHCFT